MGYNVYLIRWDTILNTKITYTIRECFLFSWYLSFCVEHIVSVLKESYESSYVMNSVLELTDAKIMCLLAKNEKDKLW